MSLAEISIIAWLVDNKVKTEKGDPIDFYDHPFLYDIYRDDSPNLVVIKAAQVGLSTLEVLKLFYEAHSQKLDCIYTLPTDQDRNIFVGGKVNRIIEQNPVLMEWTKDKDSVEQKKVGDSMIYFRGTKSKTAALMVPADRVVNDEKDASEQQTVKDYENRLQHSKYKQKHVFSHPSVPSFGVDVEWQQSDQKHWYITCPHCRKEQYLRWEPDEGKPCSIDLEKKAFVCIYCNGILSDDDRRNGRWVAKYTKCVCEHKKSEHINDKCTNESCDCQKYQNKKKYSGYWVSLLMAPWVTAEEIIAKFKDPDNTLDNFFNKAIGIPFIGKGNKLVLAHINQNVTDDIITPETNDRVIIGIDTGLKLDYVMGTANGLFFHGSAKDYDELDAHMERWPRAVAMIDGGGDLIGSRKFKEKWKGRVFLGFLTNDKAITDNILWNEEEGMASVDRNKYVQIVVDEIIENRLPLQGTEDDWYDYWLDWNNLHRIKVIDSITNQFKGYKWVRSGRDHRALATVFWRAMVTRFPDGEVQFNKASKGPPEAPTVDDEGKIPAQDLLKNLKYQKKKDWRST